MPVQFISVDTSPLCVSGHWSVIERPKLVRQLAMLACGAHIHARAILQGDTSLKLDLATYSVTDVLNLLGPIPAGSDPWHRDGYVFQMISWVCAHKKYGSLAMIRPPQDQTAAKGLDGLVLEFDVKSKVVSRLVICEVKATDDPRDTVRDKVWPEFEEFEAGKRDSQLVSQVSALLSRINDDKQVIKVLKAIQWKEVRAYRVNITVPAATTTKAAIEKVFKGFEKVVKGKDANRRIAELHPIEDLRPWMNKLCKEVCGAIRAMGGK